MSKKTFSYSNNRSASRTNLEAKSITTTNLEVKSVKMDTLIVNNIETNNLLVKGINNIQSSTQIYYGVIDFEVNPLKKLTGAGFFDSDWSMANSRILRYEEGEQYWFNSNTGTRIIDDDGFSFVIPVSLFDSMGKSIEYIPIEHQITNASSVQVKKIKTTNNTDNGVKLTRNTIIKNSTVTNSATAPVFSYGLVNVLGDCLTILTGKMVATNIYGDSEIVYCNYALMPLYATINGRNNNSVLSEWCGDYEDYTSGNDGFDSDRIYYASSSMQTDNAHYGIHSDIQFDNNSLKINKERVTTNVSSLVSHFSHSNISRKSIPGTSILVDSNISHPTSVVDENNNLIGYKPHVSIIGNNIKDQSLTSEQATTQFHYTGSNLHHFVDRPYSINEGKIIIIINTQTSHLYKSVINI